MAANLIQLRECLRAMACFGEGGCTLDSRGRVGGRLARRLCGDKHISQRKNKGAAGRADRQHGLEDLPKMIQGSVDTTEPWSIQPETRSEMILQSELDIPGPLRSLQESETTSQPRIR